MTGNMAIWNAVEKTDPAYTKHVGQRGGFTAISANYQVMQATKQFGPIGIGWGYDAGAPIFHDRLLFVQVTLWHGDRANRFGPMLGCEEWQSSKGHIDSDVGKKATTDAVTKLLSQLGFSADVFLGKYDDQKYVAELKKEFEPKADTIDQTQKGVIVGLANAAGVNILSICEREKIEQLDHLPASRFEPLKQKLNLTIDQNTAKADEQQKAA